VARQWPHSGADNLVYGPANDLAAVLGVQYRALDNGDFDHASVLVLLDAGGRVLARSRKTGVPDPEFLAAVRAAADATMH